MSKGYTDYLIASAKEFDRALERELQGVEAPMFSEEFQEWLKTSRSRKLTDGSIVNYMRWLHKADAWILDSERDFWSLLTQAWGASDFESINSLCKDYENQIENEKKEAEKDKEYGESGKEIANWLSAFRAYREFIEEQMKTAAAEKRAHTARIEASRESAAHLLFDNQFIRWGIKEGNAENTMASYVSYIKSVNKALFCKTGHDLFHDFLPGYVKTKNIEKINEMFSAMDAKLSERITDSDDREMPIKNLNNARSALRKYAEFISSKMKSL